MKHPDDLTEAELDALDANSPKMTRKVRAELGKKLQDQLRRTQKEAQELNAKLKTLDPAQKEHEEVSALVQQNVDLIIKIVETQQRTQHPQTGITAITIENFKGISAPVTIPLRPITLLFGANSAGKSTIIQGLHYARELLERNNANPDHTLLGGDIIELGGFSNLVHRHNLDREIRLRIDITPTADGVPTLQDVLGTGDQESQVRVNPDEIRRSLSEWSKESESRSQEQEHLRRSLLSRLENIRETLSQKDAGESRATLQKHLDRALLFLVELPAASPTTPPWPQSWLALRDYLTLSLSSSGGQPKVTLDAEVISRHLEALSPDLEASAQRLALRDCLTRSLESPNREGEVSLDANAIRRHLEALSPDLEAAAQPLASADKLSRDLRHELESLHKAVSSEDSDRLKMAFRTKLETELRQLMDQLSSRSHFGPGSAHWQKFADRLSRSLESSRELNINPHVDRVSLELVARWDPDQQIGWFAECNYWVNGQPIIFIRKAKPSSRPTIEQIDLFHPVMLAMDEMLVEGRESYDEQMVEFALALISSLKLRLMKNLRLDKLGFDVVRPSTGEILIDKSQPLTDKLIHHLVECLPDVACRANAPELLPQARLEIEDAVKRFEERQVQLKKDMGFFPLIQLGDDKEWNSVAPSPERPLPFSAAALGEGREHYSDLINQIVVGITALVRDHLESFRYIGPIRAIPDRHHEAPQVEDPARWANGLGAWDLLLRHYNRAQGKGDELVEQVSKWFEDKDRLGLGYRIEVAGDRSVAEDSLLMSRLKVLQSHYDDLSQQDFRNQILQPLQTSPQSPRVRIVDTRNGTEVGPKDIGIGVAQALPIVVGALDSKCPLLAVEQPELHLHPSAQARMGDLFISAAKAGRQFILETHSELFILRLLKRIRQTTAGEVADKTLQLTPDDLGVIHLERTAETTVVTVLGVDRQGEFLKPWPGKDGFFEERARELFE